MPLYSVRGTKPRNNTEKESIIATLKKTITAPAAKAIVTFFEEEA